MKLARSLALSLGEGTLTEAIWKRACELDEQRVKRSEETAPPKVVPTAELLGKEDTVETVQEEDDESDDELEIEGGPVNGVRGPKMVGR